ncbi:MAG: MBL fold metallo-hydrolase [Thermoplasmatales archaeon]|nr:MAG: MBL fold metallo-hydrolase [Thermoplasmatales archaeon]
MAVIEQIRVGFDNFSYIIYCLKSRKSAIVDPGLDASRALEFISSKNLDLKYIINTHYHSDHSRESKRIKKSIPSSIIVASKSDGEKMDVEVDITVSDGDRLRLGEDRLDFILTPGHTPGGICIIVDDEALLTGDTLFIGDCGRTDLTGGNLEQMFITLREKIMPLPDHLIVFPGHDYGNKPSDTLGNQKRTNNTLLAKNLNDFSKIP